MSRNYETNRIKIHRAYTVASLMTLLEINQNTVSNWVRSGLVPSDERKPYVFRGSVVRAFLDGRRKRSTSSLRPGEFKCLGCKAAVFPELSTIREFFPRNGKHMFEAVCPDCSASVMKVSSQSDRSIVEDCRNPNTSRDRLHEECGAVPACIVTNEDLSSSPGGTVNDRVVLDWQDYAERFDTKTVDQHLASIRAFEAHLDGKDFKRVTKNDAASFTRSLKVRIDPDAEDGLSRSSVAHRSSQLSDFARWLTKQSGYRSLPGDLPDYFRLPKRILAAAHKRGPRPRLNIEEATQCLAGMPKVTLFERRQRAIFAVAYLGALRADTITSLRLASIDTDARLVRQDSAVVRSKNGKSLDVRWFPVPDLFGTVVSEWTMEMTRLGVRRDDALFPPNGWLEHPTRFRAPDRKVIKPMTTKHAVTGAFKTATDGRCSPHSAKNSIADYRAEFRLTAEEHRAWQQNMGHESGQTTEVYTELPVEKVASLMQGIGQDRREESANKLSSIDDKLNEVLERLGRLESPLETR